MKSIKEGDVFYNGIAWSGEALGDECRITKIEGEIVSYHNITSNYHSGFAMGSIFHDKLTLHSKNYTYDIY